jgi:hypothetical protein
MTTPEDPERQPSSDSVDLTKGEPADEAPFDPYRFGKPDHPIPAEYAPPGYTGPVTQTPPPAPGWGPPAGPNAGNPFSNPPGTPYAPYGGDPGGYPSGPYSPSPPPPAQYPGQYPAPYGPPPGYYPPPHEGFGPRPTTGNGKAVAALVLGIGSIVFFFFSFFDALLVIPALILGFIALSESRAPGRTGRGMAIAGLVCTVIGAVLATVFTVLLVHAANQCGGLDNSKAQGWNTCVRHHFF